jgi:hypothetical protein
VRHQDLRHQTWLGADRGRFAEHLDPQRGQIFGRRIGHASPLVDLNQWLNQPGVAGYRGLKDE